VAHRYLSAALSAAWLCGGEKYCLAASASRMLPRQASNRLVAAKYNIWLAEMAAIQSGQSII